jgi:hypothetical protein
MNNAIFESLLHILFFYAGHVINYGCLQINFWNNDFRLWSNGATVIGVNNYWRGAHILARSNEGGNKSLIEKAKH